MRRAGARRARRTARPGRSAIVAAPFVVAALAALSACGSPSSGRPASELYTELCVRCHGADGRGDPRFLTLTPNLDLTRSVMVARKARGLIYQRITQGYGSMPGFGHRLERGDVETLTELVLAFQKP